MRRRGDYNSRDRHPWTRLHCEPPLGQNEPIEILPCTPLRTRILVFSWSLHCVRSNATLDEPFVKAAIENLSRKLATTKAGRLLARPIKEWLSIFLWTITLLSGELYASSVFGLRFSLVTAIMTSRINRPSPQMYAVWPRSIISSVFGARG